MTVNEIRQMYLEVEYELKTPSLDNLMTEVFNKLEEFENEIKILQDKVALLIEINPEAR